MFQPLPDRRFCSRKRTSVNISGRPISPKAGILVSPGVYSEISNVMPRRINFLISVYLPGWADTTSGEESAAKGNFRSPNSRGLNEMTEGSGASLFPVSVLSNEIGDETL